MRRVAPLLALALGCREAPPPRLVLAEIAVPGRPAPIAIDEAAFRIRAARLRFEREESVDAAPLPPELQGRLLERLIDEALLTAEAERLGVQGSTTAVARGLAQLMADSSTVEVARQLVATYQDRQDLEGRLLARDRLRRLLAAEAHAGVEVTPAELEAAFRALPDEAKLAQPRVRALHIVVRTEEEGDRVLAELKQGASFGDVARRRSVAPEAAVGGDLGWLEAGSMPKVFDVCFTLKPGERSKVVASEYGYHLFQVVAAEPGHPLTFEEATPKLRARIYTEKLEAAERAYLERLRAQAKITRRPELLRTLD